MSNNVCRLSKKELVRKISNNSNLEYNYTMEQISEIVTAMTEEISDFFNELQGDDEGRVNVKQGFGSFVCKERKMNGYGGIFYKRVILFSPSDILKNKIN